MKISKLYIVYQPTKLLILYGIVIYNIYKYQNYILYIVYRPTKVLIILFFIWNSYI